MAIHYLQQETISVLPLVPSFLAEVVHKNVSDILGTDKFMSIVFCHLGHYFINPGDGHIFSY
jgi:hypothetical protein